ncbi:MAG: OmpA family protein [Gemmatimonadales bacterium]|nr:OmpA family protein [Gemmatimonadales bacterium]
MAKKKKNITIKQGLDGWVMTYGDMMSLLLTFFVLIVSFSTMQETKFEQAVNSLQEAFGVMTDAESVIEFDEPLIPNHDPTDEEAEVIYEVRNVEKFIMEQGLDDKVEVEMKDGKVLFRVDAPFMFETGRAKLKPVSLKVLDKMQGFFKKFPYEVRVEGHTDSLPINSNKFDSNWELSAGRAVSVARYFQGSGTPPDMIAATGFGEFRPIAGNKSVKGRQKNRRVEIFLQLEKKNLPKKDKLPLGNNPVENSPKKLMSTEPAAKKVPVVPIINPVTGRLGLPIGK